MTGLGELAAFGAATSWGIASHLNSAVARRTGATSLAMLRLPYMIALCGLLCLVFGVNTRIGPEAVLLLGVSGFLGIALGDVLLYRAVLIIGPTMAILVLSLSSCFTAVSGWLFLHEILPEQAVWGIGITIAGVAVVVVEHSESILMPGQAVPRGRTLLVGVGWALGAALSLTVGYLAQRMAMRTGVQPLWAGFLRASLAGVGLWALGGTLGWIRPAVRQFTDHPPIRLLLLLACFGGSVGIWASSYALANVPAGVASTITGLQPIVVAVTGAFWYRRKPTLKVVIGSLVAFGGSALVCLR